MSPPPDAAPAVPVHALVVDDDEFVRGMLVRQLKTVGAASVMAAPDWGAARVLLDRNPDCNVVVSDLDMPGAVGSNFLDELAGLRPGIALIIVSASEPVVLRTAERHARRLPLAVLGSIAKPPSVDTLRALLGALPAPEAKPGSGRG